MKKSIIFVLAALVALAMMSCSKSTYKGIDSNGVIAFNPSYARVTKATVGGATAAEHLGYQYIVYAEKNEESATAPAERNLVFNNYQVNYIDNSANTTLSNSKGWEYVGYTHSSNYHTNITPSFEFDQSIKFWDYGASNYVFTAVSANQADIEAGNVTITKVTNPTGVSPTVYDKGYNIVLTENADLEKLYIADRTVVTKPISGSPDRTAVNAYGGNVTLTFRSVAAMVRVGMYENIQGYSVKIDKFYYEDNDNPTFANMTVEAKVSETACFGANVPNVGGGTPGTLAVKYYDNSVTAIENHPTIAFTPDASKNYILLGTKINEAEALSISSASPTWDKENGDYTTFFPQESNEKTLKLKVDYTLTSVDGSHEKIAVVGATAEIPAKYLAWKPNFSYTYIFKISDNSNGYTGGSTKPEGLYPITLDAIEIASENGIQETITTVADPSITTYAHESKITADGEYKKGANIYVSVVANPAATLTTTNTKLYTATVETGFAQSITEESVANVLITCTGVTTSDTPGPETVVVGTTDVSSFYTKDGDGYYWKCTAGAVAVNDVNYYDLSGATITAYIVQDALGKKMIVSPASGLSIVTEIAASDTHDNVAVAGNFAKFTPAADGTYVFEYTDETPEMHYKVIKVVD